MKKYIDKSDAINELIKEFDDIYTCNRAIKAIERVKVAEIKKIKHGKWGQPNWLARQLKVYICSVNTLQGRGEGKGEFTNGK